MDVLDAPFVSDAFQFGDSVRRRSWDWLLALRRRLNVDLQIVDDANVPLLKLSSGSEQSVIDTVLSERAPAIRAAITSAIRTRTPQAAGLERLQIVVVPVTLDRVVGGALVVVRKASDDTPLERVRGELELVGFWLTNAIEAHLLSPAPDQADLDQVSSLCRLLAADAAQRSDSEIVATFADTMAVWHDLEIHGYAEAAHGDYVRQVTLPGIDSSRTPAVIHRAQVPDVHDVSRLSKVDVERMGFSTGQDMVLGRIGTDGSSWLIAAVGTLDGGELVRAGLYIGLLEQSVTRAINEKIASLLERVGRVLIADTGNPEEQGRQTAFCVQQALGAENVALHITDKSGASVVRVGSLSALGDVAQAGEDETVVIMKSDARRYRLAFVISWPSGHRVLGREQRAAHAVADLLEAWAGRLTQRPTRVADRRKSPRPFDDLFERHARETIESGVPVTAVVFRFEGTAADASATQGHAGRLRAHVRAGDLVGALSDHEVGVLLEDIVVTEAGALVARLESVIDRERETGVHLAVGIVGRNPGESTTNALAIEARQQVRYRAGDN